MEVVGSDLNLFEALPNQTTVIGAMGQEFAPIATIIPDAAIYFQIEGLWTELYGSQQWYVAGASEADQGNGC